MSGKAAGSAAQRQNWWQKLQPEITGVGSGCAKGGCRSAEEGEEEAAQRIKSSGLSSLLRWEKRSHCPRGGLPANPHSLLCSQSPVER